MTLQNKLELNGDLHEHPLAEVLVEVSLAHLMGSLRLANEEFKAILYFDAGDVVFAVSNARQHRLSAILLREEKISPAQLAAAGSFTNEPELKSILIKKEILSEAEINRCISLQIAEILQTALRWKDGKWNFNSLVRARGDMRYRIDLPGLLFEYARNLPNASLVRRFNSLQEKFEMRTQAPSHISLNPGESFVLSRFGENSLTVEDIKNVGGLSEIEILRVLYTLWIGGFLKRQKWNWAFTQEKIFAISTAKILLKKELPPTALPRKEISTASGDTPQLPKPPQPKEKASGAIPLEEYLERAENSQTYYELLDLPLDADTAAIKNRYFMLAKSFHPDLFHRQTEPETHRRIQEAFTKMAQAYDVLKDEKTREVYDYKIGKDDGNLDNPMAARNLSETEKQALDSFERGFSYLIDENYDEAVTLLGRAVHLTSGNARYHAYYAKALAADRATQRQAETEFLTAVKLEPNNMQYRLMLAELYVGIGHLKRAEGELNRLLEKAPNYNEARSLLDSLRNK